MESKGKREGPEFGGGIPGYVKDFSEKDREVESQEDSNRSLISLCGLWYMGHKVQHRVVSRVLKSTIRGKEN